MASIRETQTPAARSPDAVDRALIAQLQADARQSTADLARKLNLARTTVVARLARLLEIEPAEVMAVGDARNDVELLAWAGVGVAMGNAVPEAVAAADWTTAPNDAEGLALAIRWVLEGRDAR